MADYEPSTIIHQGLLIKSPPEHKSKDLGRWKKRYFKLWSNGTLEYFKSERSEKPLKKPIDLSQCRSIDGHLKNKKWENIFCLNTNSRKYFLVAESPGCMENWITKLCDICGFTVQAQGTSESFSKVKIMQTPGSPTYSKASSSSDVKVHNQDSLPIDVPGNSSCVSNELPSYDEELPPLPDSSSDSSDEVESTRVDLCQLTAGSPYTMGIKQSKSSLYSDPPYSRYDEVPPPRGIKEDALPSLVRRVSTQSENASKNNDITDESYVDMQPPSSYDTVPPPRLASEPCAGGHGTYDLLPSSGGASDEYIHCEITKDETFKEVPPPLPEQTYNGFDKLPPGGRDSQRYARDSATDSGIYDSPPNAMESGIYDIPPNTVEIGIYDTPPNAVESGIYDTPPNAVESGIYDIPPNAMESGIYDLPPTMNRMYITDNTRVTPSFTGREASRNQNVAQDICEVPPLSSRTVPRHSANALPGYDTPPVPSRNNREHLINSPPGSHRHSSSDIYDTPPSSNRDEIYDIPPISNQKNHPQDIYDTPPVPDRTDRECHINPPPGWHSHNTSGVYDTPPVSNLSNHPQDIYDTPPVPNRTENKCHINPPPDSYYHNTPDIYDTPPVSNLSNHPQDIYDTPPVPNRTDKECHINSPPGSYYHNTPDIYDTPPVSNLNDHSQDIYDTPPVPNRTDREFRINSPPSSYCHNTPDIYDTPPVSNFNNSHDSYDTPPFSNRKDSQDIYDTPPALINGSIQEIDDTRRFQNQNQRPDVRYVSVGEPTYDVPPQSEIDRPQGDARYDLPRISQRHARRGDLYDVPPRTEDHMMTHIYDEQNDETTSPADLFNFGFSLSPPSIDRSLKYASTGGIDSSKSAPPPVDRKTRPVLTTSVPVFPSEIESNTLRDAQKDLYRRYGNPHSPHEGAYSRHQRP